MGCLCDYNNEKKNKNNNKKGINNSNNQNKTNEVKNQIEIDKKGINNTIKIEKKENNSQFIPKNQEINQEENNKLGLTKNNSSQLKNNRFIDKTNSHNKNDTNIEIKDEEPSQNIKIANNTIKERTIRTNDRITNSHQVNNITQENRTKEIILNNLSKKNGNDKNIYKTEHSKVLIGKGGFGKVYKETINYKDENGNYKIVACKYIESHNLDKNKKKNFLMNFFREAGMMVNLLYKNIVKLISINSASSKLVMEYMEGGNLTNVIYNNKKLTLYFKVYCLFQICDGLKFLHDRQIIHGDLKSLNILLDSKYDGGENYPTLKLTDFGISGIKEDISPGETPGFTAPEIYEDNRKRTIKSDIYSFGVVIYEIFKGESPNKNRKINLKSFYPLPEIKEENWPEEIKKIILQCVDKNSNKRPTIEKIKNEISEYCDNSNDKKLIEVKNKAIKEVNFNIVGINDFACKLFEEIKAFSLKEYGEFIYKVNDSPYTGLGQHIFDDGTKYIGNFENGVINKYGIFFYSNGIHYNGEHFKGVWNGKGIFKYKEGIIIYKGFFKNFAFDKFGIIFTIQNNKGKIIGKHEYIGEFKYGRQNGIGIYKDPENRQYSGEWKEGNFGIIGKFEYPDGEICQGEFEKGIRQGFCYINYVDGSYFEGHCDKGKFNGYGKFFIKKGEIYEGEWKNGCPLEDDKMIID